MSKKFDLSIVLLIVLSMVLGACAPAIITNPTEGVQAPVTNVVQVPVTEVAQTQPNIATLYAAMVNSLPADKGYAAIKPAELSIQLARSTPPFLLDEREPAEVEKDGYIAGAVNISVRSILKNLDKLPGLNSYIVVYCGSAQRGGMLLGSLRMLSEQGISLRKHAALKRIKAQHGLSQIYAPWNEKS